MKQFTGESLPMLVRGCWRWSALGAVLLLAGCLTGDSGERTVQVVELITTREDGVADSQVIPILFEGEEAWLALDNGAPFTFLFRGSDDPEFVEDAGTIVLGGEQWTVPAYGDDAIGVEVFRGKPILGVLGLDFFHDVPAAIDYPGGKLVRYLDGQLAADDAELPTLPLGGREHERALIDVRLDGETLTLMFDTGAHDTIWLGVAGKDGDEESAVQTADGEIWEVFEGSGLLELPGEGARSVPVLRALEIGYVSPELRELEANGLFGLTSLGWRRVVIDFDSGVLRLGPRQD